MLPLPPECKSGALLIELHPHIRVVMLIMTGPTFYPVFIYSFLQRQSNISLLIVNGLVFTHAVYSGRLITNFIGFVPAPKADQSIKCDSLSALLFFGIS